MYIINSKWWVTNITSWNHYKCCINQQLTSELSGQTYPREDAITQVTQIAEVVVIDCWILYGITQQLGHWIKDTLEENGSMKVFILRIPTNQDLNFLEIWPTTFLTFSLPLILNCSLALYNEWMSETIKRWYSIIVHREDASEVRVQSAGLWGQKIWKENERARLGREGM